jgi:hypothetical protein
MQRYEKNLSLSLPRNRMYIEDIERIVEILKSDGCEVEIKTTEWKLADAKELASLDPTPLRELDITGRNPESRMWFYVTFYTSYASVRADTGDARTLGLGTQIKAVVDARARVPVAATTAWVAIGVWAVGTVTATVLPVPLTVKWIALGALVTGALTAVLATYFAFRNYSIIVPRRRADAPTFWQRNWEKIATHAVTAAITALFTAAVTWSVVISKYANLSTSAGVPAASQPTSAPASAPTEP